MVREVQQAQLSVESGRCRAGWCIRRFCECMARVRTRSMLLCRRVLLQKGLKEMAAKLPLPSVREAAFPREGALRACPSVVLACTRRTRRSMRSKGRSAKERPALPSISIFCGCTFDAHNSTHIWPPICIGSATILFVWVYVNRHRPTVAACAERLAACVQRV